MPLPRFHNQPEQPYSQSWISPIHLAGSLALYYSGLLNGKEDARFDTNYQSINTMSQDYEEGYDLGFQYMKDRRDARAELLAWCGNVTLMVGHRRGASILPSESGNAGQGNAGQHLYTPIK